MDVLCNCCLPLLVHVENLGEHVVGFESIQVDIKDVLALVWVEADDFVLEKGNLEESLRDEVSCRVRRGADQNARDLL
jgi:hypothetical protein